MEFVGIDAQVIEGSGDSVRFLGRNSERIRSFDRRVALTCAASIRQRTDTKKGRGARFSGDVSRNSYRLGIPQPIRRARAGTCHNARQREIVEASPHT